MMYGPDHFHEDAVVQLRGRSRTYQQVRAPVDTRETLPPIFSAVISLEKFNPIPATQPSLPQILEAVSAVTRLSMIEIVARRRNLRGTKAVFVFYYLARFLTTKSFPDIAKFCEGRNHATVMHGVRVVARNRAKYDMLIRDVMARLGVGG